MVSAAFNRVKATTRSGKRLGCTCTRRLILSVVGAALFLVPPAVARPADQSLRKYNVQDLIHLESVGRGLADSSGHVMVWEYAPPYDQQPDFSYSLLGAWTGAYVLMALDLTDPKAQTKPLFPAEAGRRYWLDSISPDGRYVAFHSARDGRFDVGLYDRQTRSIRHIAATPNISREGHSEAIWVSNETVIYATYIGNDQPELARRRGYGEAVWAASNRSWSGHLPGVTSMETQPLGALGPFKPGRLLAIDARTGVSKAIADGLYEDFSLSHDGRYIAALRQAERTRGDPAKPDLDWTLSRSQLVIFDLEAGRRERVVGPTLELFPGTLTWAADRDSLAFFGWTIGAGPQTGIYRTVDAATGTLTNRPHHGLDLGSLRERGGFQKPERAIWLGDDLAVYARANPGGEEMPRFTYRSRRATGGAVDRADWFLLGADGSTRNLTSAFADVFGAPLHTDAGALDILADGSVWRISPTAAPRNLTPGVGATLSLLPDEGYKPLDPYAPTMTLVGRSPRESTLVFVDFSAGTAEALSTGSPDLQPIATAPRSRAFLYHDAGADHDLVRVQVKGAAPRTIRVLNAQLAAVQPTRWTTLSYDADIGGHRETLQSCMLLPPDYKPGRRYPVIVDVYPGSASACETRYPIAETPAPYSFRLFAAAGYIVLQPKAPHDLIWKPTGPIEGLPRLAVEAGDAAVKAGYADPDRIGLHGVSQGGFSALWVATQTNRFKAVVSENGWADMYSHYFEVQAYQRMYPQHYAFKGGQTRYAATAGGEFNIGRTPQEDLDAYVRNSPLFQATKITAPVLLINGDTDTFSPSQYEAMFTALSQAGKQAKLLHYWGEGHGVSGPANIVNQWQSVLDWYDRYLDLERTPDGELTWDGPLARRRVASTL